MKRRPLPSSMGGRVKKGGGGGGVCGGLGWWWLCVWGVGGVEGESDVFLANLESCY